MIGDKLYIYNILESIKLIEEYIRKISFEEFSKSRLLKDAVSKRFEEIGENAKNVSNKTKKKYPKINWKEIIENRNFLSHAYRFVNNERLWNTIKKDLPLIKKQMEKIKENLEKCSLD